MFSLLSINKLLNLSRVPSGNLYWLNSVNADLNPGRIFFFLHWNSSMSVITSPKTQSGLFTIYFLKKEVYYTKLKYSRVPQFDTSSGAVASFLSGMYGFLVCEKFGFELLDSGDFLFFVVYLVWASLVAVTYTQVLNHTTYITKLPYTLFYSFFK